MNRYIKVHGSNAMHSTVVVTEKDGKKYMGWIEAKGLDPLQGQMYTINYDGRGHEFQEAQLEFDHEPLTDIPYAGDMDPECVPLCDAINSIPGLYTFESCSGHGESPFRIWFRVDGNDLDKLPHLLYWIDKCHNGFLGWSVDVRTDCAKSWPTFMIEGPVGAYEEAKKIAVMIQADGEIPR